MARCGASSAAAISARRGANCWRRCWPATAGCRRNATSWWWRARDRRPRSICGVFDGPPPGVCFPYVTVGESPCVDWSHKSGRGREVRLVLTVWDDGARAARLHGLMREVEAAVEGMQTGREGWRVVSLPFLRPRVVRDEKGPWAGLVQYRLRVMEE